LRAVPAGARRANAGHHVGRPGVTSLIDCLLLIGAAWDPTVLAAGLRAAAACEQGKGDGPYPLKG